MSQETFILVGLCVFMFLLGIRLKQRFSRKKAPMSVPIRKNQRSKMAATEEPPLVKERRLRRERRTRYFTFVLLVVLFGLMVFMIPALVRDMNVPERVYSSNFFLRCFIFVFTIYVFVLGYIKLFSSKKRTPEKPEV